MVPLLQDNFRFSERKDVGEAPWTDLADQGPGGKDFRYIEQKNILVGSELDARLGEGLKEDPGERRSRLIGGDKTPPSKQQKPARRLP